MTIKVQCQCGAIEEMQIPANDKRGFVCNACGGLFDASQTGVSVRSPLRNARVVETGSRPDIGGRLGHTTENAA